MATEPKKIVPARMPEEDHFRREAILEAVGYAAECFLRSESWKDCIPEVLRRIGLASDVSCVYIFQNHMDPVGLPLTSLRFSWRAPGVTFTLDPAEFENISIKAAGLDSWLEILDCDKPIFGPVKKFPDNVRAVLAAEQIKSFALVPVFDRKNLWGFMGFDDRRSEREWSLQEVEALRAAANILGAAIENERVKAELASSESELRSIFTAIKHAVFILDAQGRYLRVMPTNPDLLYRPAEQILGKTLHQVFPKKQADFFLDNIRQALNKKAPVQIEYALTAGARQKETWFTAVLSPLSVSTVLLVAHDITERKRTSAAAQESEAKYRQLFENLLESVFQSAPDGKIISANPAMVRLLGYEAEEELLAVNAADTYANAEDRKVWVERMTKEGELRNFEVALKRRDGRQIPVLLNARAIRDPKGQILSYEGTITDITDRKRLEAQLILLANRDPLTNLFNRRRFREELELHLSQSKRYGMQLALLWLDIDRFKDINDTLGHRSGDELLVELARLLQSLLRDHDVLSRLSGDEFAILMPHVDALQAQSVAARLLEAVHKHNFEVGEQPIRVTVSIGIALYPEHAATADKLLAYADLAMYRAKEEGRNRFSFYKLQAERSERLDLRVAWVKNIRRALDKNLFVLLAQPILDLKSDTITQHELLLRMTDPAEGLILPDAFLDIAIKFNLIQEIDHWVLRQAIRLLKEESQAGRRPVLEVNLSAKAFVDLELLALLEKEMPQVNPGSLVLDITEISTLSEFHHAQNFIVALKKLGCRCALDDFGVGLTSFQHLKHLPLDYLKIDGSLIQNLAHNPVNQHIVQAISHLTRTLGMQTIAQYVETPETIDLLREYGVDMAQGFEIGEPAPLALVFPAEPLLKAD
jgi:diguanylate cyclase (GGDEF)-like protein/PAS domain S-box-containing protein